MLEKLRSRLGLPGFRPGSGLIFSYQIRRNANLTSQAAVSTAPAPCFIATATGNTGIRVAGNTFTIDQDNVRGGGW